MNKFFKIFKAVFPHFQLVMSVLLITQWILTLFNPNLGLLSMNNIVACLELLLFFAVSLLGGIVYIVDFYRKK
ncbi:MAG: hypothetical protein IJX59_00725 [Clostridia bacterium]|nr:hypothetical protein [Clostridia bacterium]MBQ9129266.1 hypothetical protein [Clostridia bacterium]